MLTKQTALYLVKEISELIIENDVLAKISLYVLEDSDLAITFIHYDDKHEGGMKIIDLLDSYQEEEFDARIEQIDRIIWEAGNERRKENRAANH